MSQYTTNRLMSDGFTTIQTPSGTYPVADSPSDVLTLTSSNGSISIVGNAVTDTIDLTVVSGGGGVTSLNSLTGALTLAITNSGSSITISTSGSTINLNIPFATPGVSGQLSNTDFLSFYNKASKIDAIVAALIFG